MTALSKRKSKLQFETEGEVRDRGKMRQVVLECEGTFARVRLKGTQSRFPITYRAIYEYAAKCAADQVRREKAAAKAASKIKSRKNA